MSVINDEYMLRCSLTSDIQQHLPQLKAEAADAKRIIELGVRSGNSTCAFLAGVEQSGGHLWSVDIMQPRVPWWGHSQWTVLVGDDLDLADQLPDEVDVVFIDTSHHYVQTQAELELYVPKVKPGGVVMLHDVELERPDGSPATDPAFPVRVAVEEYCQEHGLVPEYVQGCYGLGVIRIPEQ